MNRIFGRLSLALGLSAAGLLGTALFNYLAQPDTHREKVLPPLAFVRSLDGVHYSKRETSMLMSALQEGDSLFAGDLIRTGDLGELRLQFVNDGLTADLEADSVFALSSNENGVALELREGYSVIKVTDQERKRNYYLHTDQGDVALKPGTLALYRELGGALSQNETVNLKTKNPLSIDWQSPATDFEGELNPEEPKPLVFTWTGPSEGHQIAIEWGESRRALQSRALARENETSVHAQFPLGRSFWRWAIYKSGADRPIWTSPSAKAVIRGKFPPAIVGPINASVLRPSEKETSVEFRWLPDSRFEKTQFELATDSKFEKNLQREFVDQKVSSLRKPLKYGTYTWRLSGQEKGSKTWIRSKGHTFKFLPREQERLSLQWLTKTDRPLKSNSPQPIAHLKWASETPSKVKAYRLRVGPKDREIKTAEPRITEKPEFDVLLEKPGSYIAMVESLDSESEVNGQSAVLAFDLISIQRLRAPAAIPSGQTLTANNRGNITLTWTAIPGAREYQLNLKSFTGEATAYRARTSSLTLEKLMPGNYLVEISAIDLEGRLGDVSMPVQIQVPSKSSVRTLKIKNVEVK